MPKVVFSNFFFVDTLEGHFIALCWGVFVAVWIIAALFTKRTVERRSSVWRILVVLAFLAIIAAQALHIPRPTDVALWPYSQTIGRLADGVAIVGLAIALWARFTLGANWSGQITFKKDHVLITSGPYAFVRHPIYTGLLLMMLATAIIAGKAFGFAFVGLMTIALWLKAREEEKLMLEHFPDAYAAYKARTKALIPFVL